MNSAFASRLVRGWVAVYTRGLPAEVRVARSDEIESDLWSQHEEAGSTGRSDTALAVEILARLVLGITADVAWRLEVGRLADRSIERSTTRGTRIIALLAILGGLGFAGAVADWAAMSLANPGVHPWDQPGAEVFAVIGKASLVAMSLSLGGIGNLLLYRFDSPIGLLGFVGALSGFMGLIGAPGAVVFLPVLSAVVVLDLARVHAVHWSVALIHAASAAGFVVGLRAYNDMSLVAFAAAVVLVYSITWIAIGLELLRGLPQARPVAPSPT